MSKRYSGQTSGLKRPQSKSTIQNPCGSKSSIRKPGAAGKDKSGKTTVVGEKGKKKEEWQLPPMSILPKKEKPTINWEKIKKDTVRRNAPEGEDIKEIRRICKEVKDLDIPVQEFINLVSPYTGDNGACLRSVMAEDLESFRKLARKVYETMTQDVSDVLVNEQLQMAQYYEEKHAQLTDKMMKAISEIYEMAPDFTFEKFIKNKEEYLKQLLPMPAEVEEDSDAIDMQKRQEAYHRLQWLRSEGERMSEENRRLQRRLEELKMEQQMEQNQAAEAAAQAETTRQELTEEENQVKEKLDKLNESVEKSFIASEATMRKEHNKSVRQPTGAVKKVRSGTGGARKKMKKPEWSSTTAAEMEEVAIKENIAVEVSKAPSASSRTSFKRPKKRSKSPHFSPIKTPPSRPPPKQTSPFHYSPPKSPTQQGGPSCDGPCGAGGSSLLGEAAAWASSGMTPARPGRQTSPFSFSPQKSAPSAQRQETRLEEVSTTVHQKRPQPKYTPGRAPQDTWGGFY